jgi:hypothetical protein
MANNDKEKKGAPRISLDSSKAARRSLARIIRMRFRNEIERETYRDLVYGLNILLSFDKQIPEVDTTYKHMSNGESPVEKLRKMLMSRIDDDPVEATDNQGVGIASNSL